MLCRARYSYSKSSVCPSVCLSETLRYLDHIGWNTSTIISLLVNPETGVFAVWIPNNMDLLQIMEHPKILAGIGVGCGRSGFRRTKAIICLKRGKIGPRLLLGTNKKSHTRIRAFNWCQNQRPWMTLKGHSLCSMHSVSKHITSLRTWCCYLFI